MATATKTVTVTLVLTGEEANALRLRLGSSFATLDRAQVAANDRVYFALKGTIAPL